MQDYTGISFFASCRLNFNRKSIGLLFLVLIAFSAPVYAVDGPVIHSFEAQVTDTNKIHFEWTSEVPAGTFAFGYIVGMGRDDVGVVDARCADGCSMDIRVPAGGFYRYVLAVGVHEQGVDQKTVELEVEQLPRVVPDNPVIEVNTFERENAVETISWEIPNIGIEADFETHFVEVFPTGDFGFVDIETVNLEKCDVLEGEDVPEGEEVCDVENSQDLSEQEHQPEHQNSGSISSTEVFDELAPGTNHYRMRYCRQITTNENSRVCSEPTVGNIKAAWAEFDQGPYRMFLSSDQTENIYLSWPADAPGTSWGVEAWTLDQFFEITTGMSVEIPATSLTEGIHRVRLTSCIDFLSGNAQCSGLIRVTAPELNDSIDGTAEVVTLPENPESDFIPDSEEIVTPQFIMPGAPIPDIAPSGRLNNIISELQYTNSSNEIEEIAVPPEQIGAIRIPEIQNQVAVGDTVVEGDTLVNLDIGHWDSIELVVDGAQWSEEHVNNVAEIESVDLYDAWKRDNTMGVNNVLMDSNENIWAFGEFSDMLMHVNGITDELTHYQTPKLCHFEEVDGVTMCVNVKPFDGATSARRNEDMIITDGKVWFAEGGPGFARIISFDPDGDPIAGKETEERPYDGRFCAYNVPGINKEVIGLTWEPAEGNEPGRLWFTEAGNEAQNESGENVLRAISSFAPEQAKCGNFFDFKNEDVVTQSDLCQESFPDCYTRMELPPEFIWPAQIVYDETEDAFWFTDGFNFSLGRFDPETEEVQRFQADWPINWQNTIGSFPWRIKIDSRYVYFNEFGDNSIVRFDKLANREECEDTAFVNNPCMDEVYVPRESINDRVHSIALDPERNRLWFTKRGGRIGWLSTEAWDQGEPCGAVYTGLDALLSGNRQYVGTTPKFMGIDVGSNGDIIAGEGSRQVIYRLTLNQLADSGCSS